MAFGLEKQLPRLNIAAANYMAVKASRGHRLHCCCCCCLTSKAASLVSSSLVWTLFLFDLGHQEPAWEWQWGSGVGVGGGRRCPCWCVTTCSSLMSRGWNAKQGQKKHHLNKQLKSRTRIKTKWFHSINQQVFLERQPHAHSCIGHWREKVKGEGRGGKRAACLRVRYLAWSPLEAAACRILDTLLITSYFSLLVLSGPCSLSFTTRLLSLRV